MKVLIPTLVILFSFSCLANEIMAPIGKHPGKTLESFSDNTLFLFFQSNCQACRKQIKEIKCLKDKYNINLLGSISKVEDLKAEYKKFNTKYPAYFADPITMAKLPIEIPATPQLILWSKPKPQLIVGLKTCEELKELLNKKTNSPAPKKAI